MKKIFNYLLACSLPAAVAGQSQKQEKGKPKILIAGTHHFSNPGKVFNAKFDNMLGEKRQQEIEQVLELLKAYHMICCGRK